MESLTEQRTMPHSVELTRNAKGEYSFVIKRYYADGEEAKALIAIAEIDAMLREQFINAP